MHGRLDKPQCSTEFDCRLRKHVLIGTQFAFVPRTGNGFPYRVKVDFPFFSWSESMIVPFLILSELLPPTAVVAAQSGFMWPREATGKSLVEVECHGMTTGWTG